MTTLELLHKNTLSQERDENEKYELIDKDTLKALKNMNNKLKEEETNLYNEYDQIEDFQFKTAKEL